MARKFGAEGSPNLRAGAHRRGGSAQVPFLRCDTINVVLSLKYVIHRRYTAAKYFLSHFVSQRKYVTQGYLYYGGFGFLSGVILDIPPKTSYDRFSTLLSSNLLSKTSFLLIPTLKLTVDGRWSMVDARVPRPPPPQHHHHDGRRLVPYGGNKVMAATFPLCRISCLGTCRGIPSLV